jgi:hypothetical protein
MLWAEIGHRIDCIKNRLTWCMGTFLHHQWKNLSENMRKVRLIQRLRRREFDFSVKHTLLCEIFSSWIVFWKIQQVLKQ